MILVEHLVHLFRFPKRNVVLRLTNNIRMFGMAMPDGISIAEDG